MGHTEKWFFQSTLIPTNFCTKKSTPWLAAGVWPSSQQPLWPHPLPEKHTLRAETWSTPVRKRKWQHLAQLAQMCVPGEHLNMRSYALVECFHDHINKQTNMASVEECVLLYFLHRRKKEENIDDGMCDWMKRWQSVINMPMHTDMFSKRFVVVLSGN